MEKKFNTKTIAGLGVLTAVVIVLQLFSNYVQFGTVSITLALIPVVVGACIYGPLGGLFLGLVQGALVMAAPSTLASFMPYSPILTIVTCLLKSGLAGVGSAYVFKLLKNKNLYVASILAAIVAPIINTGVFTIFAFAGFYPLLSSWLPSGETMIVWYLTAMVGINFIIEFAVNSLLSPVVYTVYNHLGNK